jgi:DNA-binding XRE family transcriptional regulator
MSWNGESVKKLRQKLGYTQNEFAEALGCRQQTISEWEQGLYAPANAYGKLLDQIKVQNSFQLTAREELHNFSASDPQNHEFMTSFDPAID